MGEKRDISLISKSEETVGATSDGLSNRDSEEISFKVLCLSIPPNQGYVTTRERRGFVSKCYAGVGLGDDYEAVIIAQVQYRFRSSIQRFHR